MTSRALPPQQLRTPIRTNTIRRWWGRGIALIVLAVGLLGVFSGEAPTAAQQAPDDSITNGFIDQARGTYLFVSLANTKPDYGYFGFAVPGAGLFTSDGAAQVTTSGPTAAQLVYDGSGLLDANALLDPEFTLHTRPSGQTTAVTFRLEAQLNPAQRTGTARLIYNGQQYDISAVTPPYNADPLLVQIVEAINQQNWAQLYGYADRRLRAAVTQPEFITWFGSDLHRTYAVEHESGVISARISVQLRKSYSSCSAP